MKKAVFLDRDGTINLDKGYVHKIEDFEFLPNSLKALKLLESNNFCLILITNQSGIARGYYTEKDFQILNNWLLEFLGEKGIIITDVFYCPHMIGSKIKKYNKNCNCRKPGIGLFKNAINKYNIDIDNSYAIGDKIRDLSITRYSSCNGYLIGNSEKSETINKVKNGFHKNIKYRKDLYEAALDIIKKV